MHKSKHPATICLHEGYQPTGNDPLIMPIYQTSTFVFESCEFGGECFSGEQNGNIYTRLGNPNFHAVEAKIAALEGAEAAVLTSSGMGAIAATLWTILSSGDHLIAAKTIYGCTPFASSIDNKYHYVYRITNLVEGKHYYGVKSS